MINNTSPGEWDASEGQRAYESGSIFPFWDIQADIARMHFKYNEVPLEQSYLDSQEDHSQTELLFLTDSNSDTESQDGILFPRRIGADSEQSINKQPINKQFTSEQPTNKQQIHYGSSSSVLYEDIQEPTNTLSWGNYDDGNSSETDSVKAQYSGSEEEMLYTDEDTIIMDQEDYAMKDDSNSESQDTLPTDDTNNSSDSEHSNSEAEDDQTRNRRKKRGEYNKRKQYILNHTLKYLVEHTLDGRLIKLFMEEGTMSRAMLLNVFEGERGTLHRTDGSTYNKGNPKRILIGVLSDNRKKGVFKQHKKTDRWSLGSIHEANKVLEERAERLLKQIASYKKKQPAYKKKQPANKKHSTTKSKRSNK